MVENNLESIARCLEQSLLPQYAKESEQQLKSIELSPEFSINLLKIVSANEVSPSIRLAASIFLKNLIKRKWVNENGEYLLPMNDVSYIKTEILNVMIALPNNLQTQLGECISLIAESDFPHNWNNLIDDMIAKFSTDDFVTNKSILLVGHSIFKKWRPLFRSDELFLEIKLVLDKFAEPFLMLLNKIDELIDASSNNPSELKVYLDNLLLLVQIYYDLNCQDIPEFFEDNMVTGMKIMHKYLSFDSPLISDKDNDEDVDVIIKIKTSILELINLYITRYTEVFEPLIENFMKEVWDLVTNYITKQQKYDLLIIKCLQFLTLISKISNYQNFFNNEASLNEILNKLILPNIYLREVDLELFEDEPINFVRFDLEGSEFDSRRKSATDFLRELKEINNELVTNNVMNYVNEFLKGSNENWQNKDLAIYLFSSLAAKGSVTNVGVTSTNVLVDVVQFFTDNIANDLMATSSSSNINPILITDSIRYILTFRNQLTKDQLLSVIPLLIKHLNDTNPVIYTYSAIVIDKLLSMTSFNENHEPVFNKFDLQPYLNDLLTNLFKLINLHYDSPPEKLSENEFLIKSIMRILITAEESITLDFKKVIIEQLIKILVKISKNPANPKFSHYIFESLGLLVKFSNGQDIKVLIQLILPNLLLILGDDVQEFVPYTFQILAFLLESLPKTGEQDELPEEYKQLIKPLMSPSLWQFRGNIPGITRLLIAILKYDYRSFTANGSESMTPLLGIFQKLISSKLNELHGFDLLENILFYIPVQFLEPFLKNIAILLLTRLKNTRTEKLLKKFIIFIFEICLIPVNKSLDIRNKDLNANFVINLINLPQPGVFEQLLTNLVVPNLNNFQNLRDKKIILIGLSELVKCELISSTLKIILLEQVAKNIASFNAVNNDKMNVGEQGTAGSGIALSELDLDSNSFGSNFSKLVTIQPEPFDPISEIKNNDTTQIKMVVSSNLRVNDPSLFNQLSPENQEVLKSLF